MNKQVKIEVLMSTYNGEKYIREQLDSILAQKGDFQLKVSIRDDGSVDGTKDILAEYANTQNIQVTYGNNIGVNASIMSLVLSAERDFDYFSFSDQDDVWHLDRLEKAITALNLLPSTIPLLWSCMEELTNEELEPYCNMPTPKLLGDFYNAFLQNKTPGHTQVFNATLRNILEKYPADKMHVYDWILYLLACEFGQVLFCEDICGQYRQHGNNVIGYDSGGIALLLRRIKSLRGGDFEKSISQLQYFLDFYDNQINKEHREEIFRFLSMRRNLLTRTKYAFQTKIKRDTALESFQIRLAYILGAFGKTHFKADSIEKVKYMS